MRSVLLAPRIARGSGTVAVRAGRSPARHAVVGIVVVGAALIPAIVADDPAFRLFMGALAVALAAVVAGSWYLTTVVKPGIVRVGDGTGSLRFEPPAALWAVFAVGTVLLIAASLPALLLGAGGSSVLFRWSPVILAVVGVGFLAQQLWWLRTPRGLRLDPRGVQGVRGSGRFALSWDDLADAGVAEASGARLRLDRAAGGAELIDPLWLGSDPNVVAAVVAHFLGHPDDRQLLAGGRAALRAVEAAESA